MTGFELEFTAPCPLGHAATWREQADTISAPSRLLEVACPTCDGTPPVVEELLPPLEALARNPLRRMLEAAINRRAT